MKTFPYSKHLVMGVCLCLFTLQSQWVVAQWSSDPAENNRITAVAKDQNEPSVVSDGNGGVIISWRDYRYTESVFGGEIFAQRLDSSAIPQWDENGNQINAGTLNKGHFRPLIIGTQDHNAILVWERNNLFLYDYDIYAQKLDGDGSKMWQANDVVVTDTAGTKFFHKVISDDADGVLVVWTYLPGTPSTTDIFAQRIDLNGNLLWGNNGIPVCKEKESQSNPDIASDGQGGVIIAWDDSRAGMGESKIYAQRVDAAGNIQWQSDGLAISDQVSQQGISGIVSDEKGGAIIIWVYGGSDSKGIYAQRINENGARLWGDNGVRLSETYFNDQFSCVAVADHEGGAIITWQDTRGADDDIYAQKVNDKGEIQWMANGVMVSGNSGDQMYPVALADENGGAIITWMDFRRDGPGGLYAQRLNAAGESKWQTNGIAVSTATSEQSTPVMASDGKGGAIIIWADKRNGVDYDIYAQLVNKNGGLGEFIDTDNDGIQDKEEMGPQQNDQAYDGNGDKVSDRKQGNVASFYTYDEQHYVTLAVPDSLSLENVAAVPNPAPDAPGVPEGAEAPYGFFSFSITGMSNGSHTVATLILDKDAAINHYYKYGPTPGEAAHWYEFDYDGAIGARIDADTVFLYLTDGKRGDYDIKANGVIKEPGGPLKIEVVNAIPDLEKEPFYLENYPNPALSATKIVFAVPEDSYTDLQVYDLTGKEVSALFSGRLTKGKHTIVWRTGDLKSGMFILKLRAGKRIITRKIVITR